MVAALLTFNDKLLPYTELKKVKEVQPRIKVEGEESQTAEEINVRALLPKDRGLLYHSQLCWGADLACPYRPGC